jgi:hypothetical protein
MKPLKIESGDKGTIVAGPIVRESQVGEGCNARLLLLSSRTEELPMHSRKPGEAALAIVVDDLTLPLIDSIEVQADATVEGVVHYSVFPRQPPTAHSAGMVLRFYIDGQPHEQKFEMVVFPAYVARLPNGQDVTWSQQSALTIETLVQLPPGKHRIAVHGGGYQNTVNDTAITLSHRLLYFLPLASGKR